MPIKPNRLFYTVKLDSLRLKNAKYNLSLTFDECIERGYIISLSDSQMLKTIRDITGKQIDLNLLEQWYSERDKLKTVKSNNDSRNKEIKNRIKELQNNIYQMMYIPEDITVTMDSKKIYEHMFRKGFIFNGVLYKRGGCSASQARVSTVVFLRDDIRSEVKKRLDNGRNVEKKIAATKYNAYYGLYSSASKKVTTPRFCIIPDFESEIDVKTDWCIETDWDKDDIIEERVLRTKFNRFDGSGIISPQMAEQWGRDLGEDYTPCQFCIRWCFTKGLVNEFDFVEWCRDEAGGDKNESVYIIEDIYGQKRDLREIDIILAEGMTKLWDSWESQEIIEAGCKENGIDWRITKYSPKADKAASTMNYQYIQTLDFGDSEEERKRNVINLCKDTVDYIKGVNYNDKQYSLLFLMGSDVDKYGIESFIKNSDDYWLKSCVVDHRVLDDKYSIEKIRKMIVRKIELACLGRVLVKGNYQAIIPDSYGFMEWVVWRDSCRVKGLLEDGEFYNKFWEDREVRNFGCARSPQTSKAEWVVSKNGCFCDDKDRSEKIRKYFRYSYSGIITNIHGQYTMNFAGSDFDFDIMFTTDSDSVVGHTFMERGDNGNGGSINVTGYDVPKPEKKPNLTEEDLFVSDTFSFGQQIGQLTNVCTEMYAMLPMFKVGSKERELLEKRIQMTCVAQSKQIDKTKVGKSVKGIADIWVDEQKINFDENGNCTDEDSVVEEKEFYNRIRVDKKPYFFKYKYNSLKQELKKFDMKQEKLSKRKVKQHMEELLEKERLEFEDGVVRLSDKERDIVEYYHDKYPATDSSCSMNLVCRYIEGIDFEIKDKIRSMNNFDYRNLMWYNTENDRKNKFCYINKDLYEEIKQCIKDEFKAWEQQRRGDKVKIKKYSDGESIMSYKINSQITILGDSESYGSVSKLEKAKTDQLYRSLRNKLFDIVDDPKILSNYLIYFFYEDNPGASKSTMWGVLGKRIYQNIIMNKFGIDLDDVEYGKNNYDENGNYVGKTIDIDFLVKDSNGNRLFLYESYQNSRIIINPFQRFSDSRMQKVIGETKEEREAREEIEEIEEIEEREVLYCD